MNRKSIEARRSRRDPVGFTLIELLVVIAIIGVLATLLVTGVTKGLTRAREAQCTANLKQIAQGSFAYANANRGWMPPVGGTNTLVQHLAEYVGTTTVSRMSIWRCPGDNRGGALCSYGVNRLNLSAAEGLNGWPLARVINPSRTVMAADSGSASGPVWEVRYDTAAAVREVGVEFRHGYPRSNQATPAGSAGVFRDSRANVVYYDGHVEGVVVNSLTITNWHGLP